MFLFDELSGKYKLPLFPQPVSIEETLITKKKAIIAVKSQLTQQVFLNILLLVYDQNRIIPRV